MPALEVKYEATWDGTSVTVSARAVSAEYGDIYGAVPIEKFPCREVVEVDNRLEYHGYKTNARQISAGVPFEVDLL